MSKKLLIAIISLLFTTILFAQEGSDCAKTLKKAQQVYDAGEIEKVEGMLLNCIEEGFTRAQKTEALKLIVLANLFDDDLQSADGNMKELLKNNPDFKPKENDHQEIKDVYKKFRTDPLIIVDFMAGVNLSYGYLMTAYAVDHNTSYSSYFPNVGINGGIVGNYSLKNLYRANVGFFYKSKRYTIKNIYNVVPNADPVDTLYQTIDADVRISSIEIPFGFTKEFGRGKLVPHAGIGGNIATYFNSSHTLKRSSLSDEDDAVLKQGTAVNTRAQSSLLNVSATTNVGARYKIGLTGKLIFDVRFHLGMWNQSRVNNRYENTQLLYEYYFIPDDFLLHNLSFNIGYSYLLYRPKKLKD